jgi:hypothetical protein
MTKRIGTVASRILKKMHTSTQNLSVEDLAMHIYGDSGSSHRRRIRRTLKAMPLPDGWSFILLPGGKDYAAVARWSKMKWQGDIQKARTWI